MNIQHDLRIISFFAFPSSFVVVLLLFFVFTEGDAEQYGHTKGCRQKENGTKKWERYCSWHFQGILMWCICKETEWMRVWEKERVSKWRGQKVYNELQFCTEGNCIFQFNSKSIFVQSDKGTWTSTQENENETAYVCAHHNRMIWMKYRRIGNNADDGKCSKFFFTHQFPF